MAVAAVREIISAFEFGEFVEDPLAQIPEFIDCPFHSVAEQFLQLGERQLNWIQNWVSKAASNKVWHRWLGTQYPMSRSFISLFFIRAELNRRVCSACWQQIHQAPELVPAACRL